jgi:hypothetical protein
MLINIFWSKFTKFMSVGTPYVECLEKGGVNMTLGYDSLGGCQEHLKDVCASTFSTQWQDTLDQCRSVMYADGTWMDSVRPDVWVKHLGTGFADARDNFQQYFDCLANFETLARECAATHLDQECKSKNVRVVKTVRAPMDLSEVFLKDYSNFKVVHLFRDPRGVTLSRMKADWSYAVFENEDPAILSRTYCRVILNELEKKDALETQFPDRIVSLVHDELLNDIVNGSHAIFAALNLDYSKDVSHFVEVYTKTSKRDRWRTTLTVKNIRTIENEFATLMEKAGFEVYEQNVADDKLRQKQIKEFNERKKLMQASEGKR